MRSAVSSETLGRMAARSRPRVKRVYEDPGPDDGHRVLVDRMWPRGLRKDAAAVDTWLRDVAPSHELRRWYGHDPERYGEFAERYRTELADADRSAALERLRKLASAGPVTLLTSVRDTRYAHTAVLVDVLAEG